jgi:PAS domain S-box-containing protein
MRDVDKIEEQVVGELATLRRRINELEECEAGRKRAEEMLRESDEFGFSLANTAPNPMIVINSDTSIRYVNAALEELTGFSSPELVGFKAPYPWWTQERLRKTRRDFQRAMNEGVRRAEEFFQKKDGERFWVEISTTPIRGNGQCKYYVSNWVDITERKKAEDALRESEARYRNLFDNSIEGVFTVDLGGHYTSGNKAFEELYGYTVEELLGVSYKKIVVPEDLDRVFQEYNRLFRTGEPIRDLTYQIVRKDGQRRFLEGCASLVRREGMVVGFQGTLRDITERKKADDALRESEEFSSGLLVNSRNPIVGINPDTSISYVNPALEELTGFSRAELIGRKAPYPWWTEEALERTRGVLREAMLKGAEGVELPFQKKDGERFWVEISSTPVRHRGKLKYYLSNWVDITERKRAEKEIERARDDYLAVTNLTGDIIIRVDREGKCTFANDGACEFWGKPREELLGQELADYAHPDDAERTNSAVGEGMKTKQTVKGFVSRQKTPKGWRTVEWNGSPFFDEKGDYTGFQATGRDVTEAKRAEEQLRQSEERYRSLTDEVLDSSAVGIFILDSDFRIAWVNQALEHYFGLLRGEVVGKDKLQLIRERIMHAFEDPEEFAGKLLATYDNNTYVENFECHVLPGREREERWLEHWSQPIKSGLYAGGRIEHYSDITERKKAEEKIKASLKEKEVLLQEMHHRVKNNLQVMSSLLKLQSRQIGDERYAEMLKESENRVKTMALIHEKLYQSEDLAGIDLGGYVKSLVRGLFSAYGAEAGRIKLRTEFEDIRLGVNYAMPCGLVINELVSNSLKHAFPDGKGGEIRVAMRAIGENEVELVVSDNGVGIPAGLDFRNAESLGLRLVSMLAEEQLGGQVELDRTEGTRFEIRFGVAE